MTAPYLSVICPTMRVGGLDVLYLGLKNQTFKDFELVLVDALYEHRAWPPSWDAFQHLEHLPPEGNPFPEHAPSRILNTGIKVASGRVAVFVHDYTFLPPDCLQRHADFHKSHKGRDALMSPRQHLSVPWLRKEFRPYARHEVDRYEVDVEGGRLSGCMQSIFARDFSARDADTLWVDGVWGYSDPKLKVPEGVSDCGLFNACNDSVRMSQLEAVGGFDEELDSAFGYQYLDLADRLSTLRGVRWQTDPVNVAYTVSAAALFPFPRRRFSEDRNERIWRAKRAAGYQGKVQSVLEETA